jgi:hypothetical protein
MSEAQHARLSIHRVRWLADMRRTILNLTLPHCLGRCVSEKLACVRRSIDPGPAGVFHRLGASGLQERYSR